LDANFQACLQVILADEGGFSDNPSDPGGATKYGITLATLSAWRGSVQTIAAVEALTVSDVAPIYQSDYWNAAHCPSWPAGVDLCVFDCAVNEGIGRAVRTLQTAVGVADDGLVGPATLAAVAKADAAQTIRRIESLRDTFYESLKTFPTFGRGWLARDGRTLAEALKMAGQ
jgi:lysozyme family protein